MSRSQRSAGSLRAGRRRFHELLVAPGGEGSDARSEIVQLAKDLGVPTRDADRDELDALTGGANHQGVCLLAGPYPYVAAADIPTDGVVLVLDSLQDPQNLGTLLRTAEAVGAGGVILPEHRAAGVTPAVVNASSGAVEHLRIAQVGNLARAIEGLKRAGLWVAGLENVAGAVSLWEAPLDGPLALVVGSEGRGMRRLVLEKCDFVVSLPQVGKVESLNAAVAGSIALYEIMRRRVAAAPAAESEPELAPDGE
ncbi:MAG: 23S rRNA (guanosine(2251)-2'-O)-methyltransferase RlmB [Chloroflexia bacterium]